MSFPGHRPIVNNCNTHVCNAGQKQQTLRYRLRPKISVGKQADHPSQPRKIRDAIFSLATPLNPV